MTQRPQIRSGGLSGRIFAITRFNKFSDGRIEAKEKFDVTEDVLAAVRDHLLSTVKPLWWDADAQIAELAEMEICQVHIGHGLDCGWRYPIRLDALAVAQRGNE